MSDSDAQALSRVNAYVVPSYIPKDAPRGPAAMRVSRPTQDEAHDEIDDWLESGLQSYTEEGQRIRDAANGVHVPKRSNALTSPADVAGRREEPEQTSPPPAYPEENAPALNEDNAIVPARSHESRQFGGIVRHIAVSGDYNNIHLNTGTGQQNIAHYDYRKYRDEENVQDYQVAGNGGGEEGYDGANEDRNDHENSQDVTPGYRSPIGGRDDRDNWGDDRYDGKYNGRDDRQYDDYDERYERRGRRNTPARDSRAGARYDDDDGYRSDGGYYSYSDESEYSDW
ncbi:hypothetical protein J4E83_004204 [Alternaria metachromatica]|uniref:uncharacterized protein n=1 Tax=Alternaria metachromatica TaxID=283354 RepID=UPI0020C4D7B8|nr:uncharacterized protein J4E83_004204 [Alternaria metachromatica]XP_049239576.1 uncharacterized protein J4E84_010070 [Alternaria hordeiaustralica]KAI4624529.1 hypothetical protein J4E83_004204 [Alternaria metachromatica]KAI4675328.1 hypothetical protein J4E84_010070 [Alternaria hordeiaustralica]